MASMDGGSRKTWRAEVDRISSLPDEVLSHILSLVPTKCAVGTSILSSRWKYLWTSITSFDLKGPPSWGKVSHLDDFYKSVDKVFRGCTTSQVHKFSLHMSLGNKFRITAWIEEAVKRNAREVDIYVEELPLSIFNCKTVSVLTFSASNCDDVNIVTFDLPCLKVLHINWERYWKDLLEKLVSSCPVLEDLTLAGYLTDENFMVSSSALKTLRLQLIDNIKGPVTLTVKAPNLKYLHLDKLRQTLDYQG